MVFILCPRVGVGMIVGIRLASYAIARLDVEAEPVAFLKDYAGGPYFHLTFDRLIWR